MPGWPSTGLERRNCGGTLGCVKVMFVLEFNLKCYFSGPENLLLF
jgi:hypothetical protein